MDKSIRENGVLRKKSTTHFNNELDEYPTLCAKHKIPDPEN